MPPRKKCAPCKMSFDNKGALRAHFTESGAHPTCAICKIGCRSRLALAKHLKTKHHFCLPCDRAFDAEEYHVHMATEHNYCYCTLCSKSFALPADVVTHISYSKMHVRCPTCSAGFGSDQESRNHLRVAHANEVTIPNHGVPPQVNSLPTISIPSIISYQRTTAAAGGLSLSSPPSTSSSFRSYASVDSQPTHFDIAAPPSAPVNERNGKVKARNVTANSAVKAQGKGLGLGPPLSLSVATAPRILDMDDDQEGQVEAVEPELRVHAELGPGEICSPQGLRVPNMIEIAILQDLAEAQAVAGVELGLDEDQSLEAAVAKALSASAGIGMKATDRVGFGAVGEGRPHKARLGDAHPLQLPLEALVGVASRVELSKCDCETCDGDGFSGVIHAANYEEVQERAHHDAHSPSPSALVATAQARSLSFSLGGGRPVDLVAVKRLSFLEFVSPVGGGPDLHEGNYDNDNDHDHDEHYHNEPRQHHDSPPSPVFPQPNIIHIPDLSTIETPNFSHSEGGHDEDDDSHSDEDAGSPFRDPSGDGNLEGVGEGSWSQWSPITNVEPEFQSNAHVVPTPRARAPRGPTAQTQTERMSWLMAEQVPSQHTAWRSSVRFSNSRSGSRSPSRSPRSPHSPSHSQSRSPPPHSPHSPSQSPLHSPLVSPSSPGSSTDLHFHNAREELSDQLLHEADFQLSDLRSPVLPPETGPGPGFGFGFETEGGRPLSLSFASFGLGPAVGDAGLGLGRSTSLEGGASPTWLDPDGECIGTEEHVVKEEHFAHLEGDGKADVEVEVEDGVEEGREGEYVQDGGAGYSYPSLACKICWMDPCQDPTATFCGHVFCNSCITREIAAHSRCPTCQTTILLYCLFRLHLY